jgi:hypothetical protein
MRELNRRQFTQNASLAFLAGVVVTVTDCGGGGGGGGSSDGYGPTGGSPTTTLAAAPTGNKTGSISANHGHTAVITAAELSAGGALSLRIEGTAGHNHMLDLPAQAITDVRDGRKVEKMSTSTDAHTHMVTFNSDVPEDPQRY